MNTRQEQIINLLKTNGYLSITELANLLRYSKSTIRRDLIKLASDKLLKRTPGGAVLIANKAAEAPANYKKTLHADEKSYIATIASRYLKDGQTIFLDSGTTSNTLAYHLRNFAHINIFTTNIATANFCSVHTRNATKIFGGKINDVRISGSWANKMAENINYDIAFLSCRGIDKMHGITDQVFDEAILKNTVVDHAKKVILLVDDSKFDHWFTYSDMEFKQLDTVITNKRPDEEYVNIFQENDIELEY